MTYSKKNAAVLSLLTASGTLLLTGSIINRNRWNPAPALLTGSAILAGAAAAVLLAKPAAQYTTQKLQTALESVSTKPLQEFDQADLDDLLATQTTVAETDEGAAIPVPKDEEATEADFL
jgi:hypothetical protein